MNNIILTAVLVASFVCIVTAYSMGVRHGLNASKGIVPKTPLQAVTGAVEAITRKPDEMDTTMDDIMAYSFDNALLGIKKQQQGGGS